MNQRFKERQFFYILIDDNRLYDNVLNVFFADRLNQFYDRCGIPGIRKTGFLL